MSRNLILVVCIILVSSLVVHGSTDENIDYMLDEDGIMELTELEQKENPIGFSEGCLIIARIKYRTWNGDIKTKVVVRPPYVESGDGDKERIRLIVEAFYYRNKGISEILEVNGIDINMTDLREYGGVIEFEQKLNDAYGGLTEEEYLSKYMYRVWIGDKQYIIGKKAEIDEIVKDKGVLVFVDDIRIYSETPPYIRDGRIMLPFRKVFESIGAKVDYDFSTERRFVYARIGDKKLTMVIGEDIAQLDGQEIKMDVVPEITNGKTFIPIRYAGQPFGYEIHWFENYRAAFIITEGR